jgi:hypothetical protein
VTKTTTTMTTTMSTMLMLIEPQEALPSATAPSPPGRAWIRRQTCAADALTAAYPRRHWR